MFFITKKIINIVEMIVIVHYNFWVPGELDKDNGPSTFLNRTINMQYIFNHVTLYFVRYQWLQKIIRKIKNQTIYNQLGQLYQLIGAQKSTKRLIFFGNISEYIHTYFFKISMIFIIFITINL